MTIVFILKLNMKHDDSGTNDERKDVPKLGC